jgi:hypothetical protein
MENFRLYYGLYRGTVTRNDDPEKRGRIQAKVLQVGHTRAPDEWIDPAFDSAGLDRGWFSPPEVGDSVRVGFEHGKPAKPIIYFGGWFGGDMLPEELAYTENQRVAGQTNPAAVPERRGFVTRKGHRFIFSDVDGEEQIELVWHRRSPTDPSKTAETQGDRSKSADRSIGDSASFVFTPDGDIVLTNKNGSTITLGASEHNIIVEDENGNKLTMSSAGVVIETKKAVVKAAQVELGVGADAHAVRGEELMLWLKSHTHSTAWGPSGPPISPPPQQILSKNVKVK